MGREGSVIEGTSDWSGFEIDFFDFFDNNTKSFGATERNLDNGPRSKV